MDEISLSVLIGALIFLIFVSGFFSGSETGLMSLNRYRLRHLADKKNKAAIRTQRLLERPEKLIGLILLGNNFVNILAASIATVIGLRVMGEAGIAVATGILTFVILIFARILPAQSLPGRPHELSVGRHGGGRRGLCAALRS